MRTRPHLPPACRRNPGHSGSLCRDHRPWRHQHGHRRHQCVDGPRSGNRNHRQIAAPRYNVATHQVLDSVAFYRPVTKWSASVHPGSAAETMHKAIRIAASERPGPVHLTLSSDLAKAEAGGKFPTTSPVRTYLGMGAPCKESLSKAKGMIAAAGRPIIFAGLGVLRANAGDGLVGLAEKLGAPVIVMPKAKGVIPEDHPLFAGVFEMLGDKLVLELGGRADLIVACGLDVVEFDKPWNFQATVVHVDALPNRDEFYPAEVGSASGDLRRLG